MKFLKHEHNIDHPYINDVLVLDIETDGLDTNTANTKFFGCYSYREQKYYLVHGSETHHIKYLLESHRVHVGFNSDSFDMKILEREHPDETMYKTRIDLLKVLYDYDRKRPNRESLIKLNDGRTMAEALKNRKLKTIAETLGFPLQKGDIDYKVFQRHEWTREELKKIYLYLYHDVDITRRLFEFYLDYFDGFRDMVGDDDIKNFSYIKCSGGSFAYKAICYLAGLPVLWPETDEERTDSNKSYTGGFVMEPVKNYSNDVLYLDFASLYPMNYIQCNLFSDSCSCCSDNEKWHGGGLFDVKGKYCVKSRGVIESVIADLYIRRLEYKSKKDPREKSVKVILNSMYGISASPIFRSIYREFSARDCTAIGRGIIQYTAKRLSDIGATVVYGDTDSVFIEKNGISTQEIMSHVDIILDELRKYFPFPF